MSLIEEITTLVHDVESALERVGALEAEIAAVKDTLSTSTTGSSHPGVNVPPVVAAPAPAPADPVETVGPAAADAQTPAETPQAPEEPSTVPGDAAPEFGTADQVYPPAGDRGAQAEEPVADAAPAESVPAPDEASAPAPSE